MRIFDQFILKKDKQLYESIPMQNRIGITDNKTKTTKRPAWRIQNYTKDLNVTANQLSGSKNEHKKTRFQEKTKFFQSNPEAYLQESQQ